MPDEILEKYISDHINATTDDLVMFSWHGGEPLLAGIDFYKKAVKLQRKYLPAGKRLLNGIQTNGTLLTDEFCRFMAGEGFIAGISIDGPEKIHNSKRVYNNSGGSFEKVIRGYELLKRYGITSEILCVTGSHNQDHPLDVYRFFKSVGARYMTFLPLVVREVNQPGQVSGDSVDPVKWGDFLISIFDEWVANDIGTIQIQMFEETTRVAFNQEHTLCIFKKGCGGVPVIEKNGDFYSCDHFVDSAHLLGNIADLPVAAMLDSKQQKEFGDVKAKLPAFCRQCEVLDMCNGECPKNRFISTPDGEPGLNYLCPGYRKFFNHCRPFIDALRTVWLRR